MLWELCNACKNKEFTPEDWLESIVFSIYKKGNNRDPYNYRLISLLNVVSKIYECLLYNRLSKYSEDNGKNPNDQGEFRKNRGCADQIYILNAVFWHMRTSKTYCAYIDVKKAFDSVWREVLWRRL